MCITYLYTRIMNKRCGSVSLDLNCGQDTGDTKDPGSPGREEHNCFHNQMLRKKKT